MDSGIHLQGRKKEYVLTALWMCVGEGVGGGEGVEERGCVKRMRREEEEEGRMEGEGGRDEVKIKPQSVLFDNILLI